jgi:hypothetical protein
MVGNTREYVSSVMAMLACPRISETILGLTFLERSSVAHLCLKSWNLIPGNSARLRNDLKRCVVM